MVYVFNGILFCIKNEFLPFVTMWMDSEYFMLSEISPAETGTNNITYM